MGKRKRLTAIIIILILSLIITACQKNENGQEEEIPKYSATTFMMDTLIQIKAYGENAREVVDECFDRLSEIEDEMSVSIESSEIFKINNNPGKAIKVNEDTFRVIKKALEYAKMTNGSFDPSIGPLVKLWGIGTKGARVPTDKEIKENRKKINYQWIEINNQERTVKIKAGMSLDLGAIAKGYAADEVRRIVQQKGAKSAFVNLGGNVLVIGGKPDGSPWRIGIQDPRLSRGGIMASIELKDKTVVTSGNYERYFKEDGVIYHHIIDPRTGRPSRSGLISVSIITKDSFDADSLSTSVFILGAEKGMELVNGMEGVEALLITDNLGIIISDGIKDNIKIRSSDFELIGSEYDD